MKKQSAGEFSRTISGQWSKSEKRQHASRQIMSCKIKTHKINKEFHQKQAMKFI